MTPLPPAPGILRVELLWQVDDDTSALTRTFWHHEGGSPSGGALAALAADVISYVGSHLAPLYLASTVGLGTVITDLASDTSLSVETLTDTPGTRSGSRLSPGTAAVVSLGVARRYRGGHPRLYFPFGASADVTTGGEWTTGFASAVSTAWSAFISSMTGQSDVPIDQQVNVSYYKGSTVVINPVTGRAKNVSTKRSSPQIDNITGVNVGTKIGSQRRRNRKS